MQMLLSVLVFQSRPGEHTITLTHSVSLRLIIIISLIQVCVDWFVPLLPTNTDQAAEPHLFLKETTGRCCKQLDEHPD